MAKWLIGLKVENIDDKKNIHQVNIHQETSDHLTALHMAIIKHNLEIVNLLLRQNPHINKKMYDGYTIAHYAAQYFINFIKEDVKDKNQQYNAETLIGSIYFKNIKKILTLIFENSNHDTLAKAKNRQELTILKALKGGIRDIKALPLNEGEKNLLVQEIENVKKLVISEINSKAKPSQEESNKTSKEESKEESKEPSKEESKEPSKEESGKKKKRKKKPKKKSNLLNTKTKLFILLSFAAFLLYKYVWVKQKEREPLVEDEEENLGSDESQEA